MTLHMALGTMHFGTRVAKADAFAILDAYVEAGGTWVDTADCYAFWNSADGVAGQSESVLGEWLAARPSVRADVLISTKVGAQPTVVGGFPDHVEGLGADSVRAGLDASLRRLGVDHVELYWAHMQDRRTPLTETVAAFAAVCDEGRATRIGLSNHPVWRLAQAREMADQLGVTPFTAAQQRWSYLAPRPQVAVEGQDHPFGMMTPETLDFASSTTDVELWGYTALLNGFYDRPDMPLPASYDHPGTTERLSRLDRWSRRVGLSRGQLVLAWMVAQQPAVRPIVGVSSVDQLASAVVGVSTALDAEVVTALT